MKINVYLDLDYCTVAIQHALNYKHKINSFKSFKNEVESYLIQYGQICIDDHEGEYSSFKNEADLIVGKYFK